MILVTHISQKRAFQKAFWRSALEFIFEVVKMAYNSLIFSLFPLRKMAENADFFALFLPFFEKKRKVIWIYQIDFHIFAVKYGLEGFSITKKD
jgi:hypothetical protein